MRWYGCQDGMICQLVNFSIVVANGKEKHEKQEYEIKWKTLDSQCYFANSVFYWNYCTWTSWDLVLRFSFFDLFVFFFFSYSFFLWVFITVYWADCSFRSSSLLEWMETMAQKRKKNLYFNIMCHSQNTKFKWTANKSCTHFLVPITKPNLFCLLNYYRNSAKRTTAYHDTDITIDLV